jgi:MFS family permease
MTLAQLLGAVLPTISRDYRDSGPASFVPIFIAVGFALATLSGLVFGTAWWLALLVIAKIRSRATRRSLVVSVIAVAGIVAVAGGISAAIAPRLYTDLPLSSPWFDFVSVALVAGAATSWLLLKSDFFRLDQRETQPPSARIESQ